MKKISLLTLCMMTVMTACGQSGEFSKEEKNAVLDTLAANFTVSTLGRATEDDPSDEFDLESLSRITDPLLLEEYRETRSIRNNSDKPGVDSYVRLKIEDHNLVDENGNALEMDFSSAMNYNHDESCFYFRGNKLLDKDGGLYQSHWIRLRMSNVFRKLKGYMDVCVYFPGQGLEQKVRVPVDISVFDDSDE